MPTEEIVSEAMNKSLEPDERFVEFLEWQLLSEHRRASRLRPAAGRIAVPRWAAAAALAFGFLTTGVTVIKASEMIKDGWRKKIEVARAQTEIRLAESRLDSARTEAARLGRQVALGLAPTDDGRQWEIFAREREIDVRRARANREEAEITGGPARDELYAPRAGGRDFVLERLKMDLESSALRSESIAVRAERVQRLEAVGLVSKEEGAALKREAEAETGRAEEIRGRIALRERFLQGKADALQVEVQGRLAEVALRLKSAQARVESYQEKLARLTRMSDLGLVPVSEVRTAQAGLEIAKAELAQAVLERDILSQVK